MPKKKRGRSPAPKKPPKSPAVTSKTSPVAPKTVEWIGSMKDTVEILGDTVSPANDEDDWEALRD
jgi:hypothetical protein